MKLPISFGSRFFFRIVFPGAALSAVLSPLTYAILVVYEFDKYFVVTFLVQLFIIGWLFVVLDMPIYMALEGRRYWPRRLINFGRSRERRRLARLHKRMRRFNRKNISADDGLSALDARHEYLEAAVEISNFPLSERSSFPKAEWPTRLGNLIASYEQYPGIKYGLDAIFFWPRIWVSIDTDLRNEIDNHQSQVDGLLYLSVALFIGSFMFFIYGLFDLCLPDLLPFNFEWQINLCLLVATLLASYFIYRVSMFSHAQFGENFKAVFDQYRHKLEIEDTMRIVAEITSDYGLVQKSSLIQNVAVWRYLRWHRVRMRNEQFNRRVLRH